MVCVNLVINVKPATGHHRTLTGKNYIGRQIQSWKMRDQMSMLENAGPENFLSAVGCLWHRSNNRHLTWVGCSYCYCWHLQLRMEDLLVQNFTTHMPLLAATSAFGLGRRHWSSPQQCYLQCLHTFCAQPSNHRNCNTIWSRLLCCNFQKDNEQFSTHILSPASHGN